MWNKLKDIFSPETYEEGITSNSAIAAILVRAAKTDNEYTESEKKLIDYLLANNLNISQEDARLLRLQGQELEMEINDNVQLTRIIKQDIPYEDRHQLIEQLWSIVLDDNNRTPEENKLMRVLTHLLGISDVNSAKARSKVLNKKNLS
ncbi:MAG: TerB family tellurite resistance protein [Pseudomonadota bacterium]|nr:TerB family tellurite resistance protein [Pseudomonadota bacterium]